MNDERPHAKLLPAAIANDHLIEGLLPDLDRNPHVVALAQGAVHVFITAIVKAQLQFPAVTAQHRGVCLVAKVTFVRATQVDGTDSLVFL